MLLIIYPIVLYIIMELIGQDVSKYVCYFDLVAMVTIQGLLLA